jgi:hypothetical protein
VELQQKSYPAELEYEGVQVCIWDRQGSQCTKYWYLSKGPGVSTGTTGSYGTGVKISVLTINENKYVFNFETAGKYEILLVKSYSKDIPGRSVGESFNSSITIPIEISDVTTGGFVVKDLATVGILLQPFPILRCPEKIKNINQSISCDLYYYYDPVAYKVRLSPFENFKICAYKVSVKFSECSKKQNPYFSRDLKIGFNTVTTIKIPVSKNVDTAIYLRWDNEEIPYDENDAAFEYYSNKPIKYPPVKKEGTDSGKWVKKCKTITARKIFEPGELTDLVLNGGSGSGNTYRKEVCENVWVR